MKITIIVPILNERTILEESLSALDLALTQAPGPWEVVLSDAGSQDGSAEWAKAKAKSAGWIYAGEPISAPSVGKTVQAGIAAATGAAFLIYPVDSRLESQALTELRAALESGLTECGGFQKRYFPVTPVLLIYQNLQNGLRFRLLKHVVWTHGIFFKRELLNTCPIPDSGFLEDVILSDALRRSPRWTALRSPIVISSRRYYPNKVLRRIAVNGFIMLLYRLRLVSIPRLRKLYTSIR